MSDYPIKGTVKLVVDDATAKLVEAEKRIAELEQELTATFNACADVMEDATTQIRVLRAKVAGLESRNK